MAPLTKPIATWQYFTKSLTIYKEPKYYFGNYLQKKPKYYFGNYLQKKHKYYFGNYF